VTDKLLQGLALQVLNIAKSDMQRGRWSGVLLAHYFEGKGLKRMRDVEKLIGDRLGEDWLNSGAKKDLAFGLIKICVQVAPPDALMMVTLINAFKPTPAFTALPEVEQHALLDRTHDHHHEMVAEGLLTVHDALHALAQTPQRICAYIQRVDTRRCLFTGKPEIVLHDQEGFDGRVKMYGLKESEMEGLIELLDRPRKVGVQ